ncbi:MAG: hypothetical protein A2845_04140 [Candidatus Lloydbacteria bacterium RIFCSPHIGHO2_01_FULL_49_22]|uniref:SUF system FeS cluster assembly SufBD core domain-containing protein n=1 Tax=Candidatus Lloydbacteria bacterium RIFCSPHIGHO2_01_FULL_49_22 TaxID=1798658 RepID=A0A1G2CXL2_9BACT|nr:MAG: hypothetical protein A2845_04140 [Candidatus Lloydbacteria bacterium RIFCSPHIGHO2_01_FULL_49_22]OGZ09116.1 MAG: hypothetical protein A3C14_03975 [Candidatus Lloydbacteria bacterium RIFCSPHIGHO2_02_FULL_50_18]
MSDNILQLTNISSALKEPEWLLAWRKKQTTLSSVLPKAIKHGIGISALFPEIEPDFSAVADYHVDTTKGLEIYTWSEAVTQEEVEPILKGLLESAFFPAPKDFFRAKGQALFASGLVVYVQPNMADDGTFITEKLTLDTMLPTGSSSDIIVVIIKEGAKCDLTLNTSGGAFGSMHSRTLVVVTEADSIVRVTKNDRLESGAMAMHFSRGVVAGNSHIVWREILGGDMLVSSVTNNLLIGSGANATVLQALIARDHGEFDVDVSAEHLADDTHSAICTAGTGADTSKILYRGLVSMKEGVHRVAGAQEAKFLMLTPGAKIDAIPSLDVASNDVACAHKLSISHVREGDMFYPKLRGLGDDESRALFLEAHFAHVFSGEENADILNIITPLFLGGSSSHAA